MTTSRGPALVVLDDAVLVPGTLRVGRGHVLIGPGDADVATLEHLDEVGGVRFGRVRVSLADPLPDVYLPPLWLPQGAVVEAGGKLVVSYPRGFRGQYGERGVVVELLTPAVWQRFGITPEATDQATIDRLVEADPWSPPIGG